MVVVIEIARMERGREGEGERGEMEEEWKKLSFSLTVVTQIEKADVLCMCVHYVMFSVCDVQYVRV